MQKDINEFNILYIDPDKKRTNAWLEALRLQLPAGLTRYGSLGKITYVTRDVNGYISFGETSTKTAVQLAFEAAKKKSQ